MVKMLASCRGIETRFLVRTLVQNVRTGATLTSVLSALAMAAVLHHNHKGTPERVCMSTVSFVPVYCPEWSNGAIHIV
jgi:DNA ligase-1